MLRWAFPMSQGGDELMLLREKIHIVPLACEANTLLTCGNNLVIYSILTIY